MAERSSDRSKIYRRSAAAFALAFGAAALYKRRRKARDGEAPNSEFARGRGTPQGPVHAASREAGYDLRDANVRSLVTIMVVSVAIMGAGITGVFLLYTHFDRDFQAESNDLTAEQRAPIPPPLPHLQADPYHEIDATLMEQKRRLDTYGWDDAAHTKAHIPIVRAMQEMVGKPLDTPAQAATTKPAAMAPVALPSAPPQEKPPNRMQGEGRPTAIAPSYDPNKTKPSESK